jgi:3-isopropylmalate/(R)-2-methylmalate dehydratase small subunit
MTENPAAITNIEGRALPFQGNDVDTDRIIPARFLRCVTFDGLGEQVFRDERFDESGAARQHPFNDETYTGAAILFVNRNFGCGSSREHAPQAIMRFGIKAIVGESFAEIFAGNCTSLGIPVMTGDEATLQQLQSRAQEQPDTRFSLDLEALSIGFDGQKIGLEMNSAARTALLGGTWNTLDELLLNEQQIEQVSERLPYINGF